MKNNFLQKKDISHQSDLIQQIPHDILVEGDDLLSDFINEAEEGLDHAESNILAFEKNPENPTLIDPIFRTFHTIKGTAGFMGLVEVGEIAHIAEDILAQIREGDVVFTHAISEAFLRSIDVLKHLFLQVREIIQKKPPTPVDIKSVLDMFSSCLAEKGDSPIPPIHRLSKKVGEILLEEGELTPEQLDIALETQEKPIGEILVKEGILPWEKVEEALKKQLKPQIIDMVKVPAEKLDELSELVGELVVAVSILSQSSTFSDKSRESNEHLDRLEKVTESLHDRILGVRMFPLEKVFSRLLRQVRDLSKKSGKKIELTIEGGDILVDKVIIDGIYAPLVHIIRNATDHGIEEEKVRQESGKEGGGHISLCACHIGDAVIIKVQDDGKGLQRERILEVAIRKGLVRKEEKLNDQQVFALIFQAGFSTAKKVTDVSGRGVGMDVVKRDVENLRGKLQIQSEEGKGTTLILQFPLSTSLIEGLVVGVGENRFIIPILEVQHTITPKEDEIIGVCGKEGELLILRGKPIPIIRLHQIYNIPSAITNPSKSTILLISFENKEYGLMVDDLLHRQQVVIKNLGDRFARLKGISGGTILGDGRIGLILEPEELIREYLLQSQTKLETKNLKSVKP